MVHLVIGSQFHGMAQIHHQHAVGDVFYHRQELGTYDEVYHNPLHPYTKALMSAVPIPDPDLEKNKTRGRRCVLPPPGRAQ
jgi:oligopeptide transport system ATP-binding protein